MPAENRVIFFDNLRWLLVICVLLQHSANAYSKLEWWPVEDNFTSLIVDGLRAFIDAFAMPLLFYIAGYFAIPTIDQKGVAVFLEGKLKRLGIPWLICIMAICPILPFIDHYTRCYNINSAFLCSYSYVEWPAGSEKIFGPVFSFFLIFSLSLLWVFPHHWLLNRGIDRRLLIETWPPQIVLLLDSLVNYGYRMSSL